MNSPPAHPRITLPGIRFELAAGQYEALLGKLDAVLQHDPEIVRLNIRLHKNARPEAGYHYRATAEVECHGPNLVAGAEGMEAYATVEALAAKLDEQLAGHHAHATAGRDGGSEAFNSSAH